jgi:hypothetical protein
MMNNKTISQQQSIMAMSKNSQILKQAVALSKKGDLKGPRFFAMLLKDNRISPNDKRHVLKALSKYGIGSQSQDIQQESWQLLKEFKFFMQNKSVLSKSDGHDFRSLFIFEGKEYEFDLKWHATTNKAVLYPDYVRQYMGLEGIQLVSPPIIIEIEKRPIHIGLGFDENSNSSIFFIEPDQALDKWSVYPYLEDAHSHALPAAFTRQIIQYLMQDDDIQGSDFAIKELSFPGELFNLLKSSTLEFIRESESLAPASEHYFEIIQRRLSTALFEDQSNVAI